MADITYQITGQDNAADDVDIYSVSLPEDIGLPALRASRRLQALDDGVHLFVFIKRGQEWLLSLIGNGKAEKLG